MLNRFVCFGIVGLLVASCSGSSGSVKTAVVMPGANGASMTLPARDSNRLVTVGSMMLCLTGPLAKATITGVTPYQGNGHIAITSYATRPNPFQHHGEAVVNSFKSLAALGFPTTQPAITVPCHTTQDPKTHRTVAGSTMELAVTYRRVGNVTGADHGTDIHYTVEGVSKTAIGQISVTMCGTHDHTTLCS